MNLSLKKVSRIEPYYIVHKAKVKTKKRLDRLH